MLTIRHRIILLTIAFITDWFIMIFWVLASNRWRKAEVERVIPPAGISRASNHTTRISCHWQTNAARCIIPNVLQTNKVDAQCDKLTTELSWERLESKVTNVQLPHLHLAPPLEVTLFEFCQDFRHQKTIVAALSCGVVCTILCLPVSVEHRHVSDGRTNRQTHDKS